MSRPINNDPRNLLSSPPGGIRSRPILFSAPMVRALLAGTKTQTRRVVKPHLRDDAFVLREHGDGWWPYRSEDGESPKVDNMQSPLACPYGKPGDRLWVKETWAQPEANDRSPVVYRADLPANVQTALPGLPNADGIKWKSSLFMPRAASRILLEVVGVRVERLSDCSEADALAEGAPGGHGAIPGRQGDATPLEHYRHIWESINGAGSWDANPLVWVVEFRRIASAAPP